jgi:hypothetical protein
VDAAAVNLPYGETITRLRATVTEDEYHNQNFDWTSPASLAITGAAVALGGTFDVGATDRQPTESDFDLYLPSGSDVASTDRLIVRGKTCDIVGDPFDWRSPFTGWSPGMLVRAAIREG